MPASEACSCPPGRSSEAQLEPARLSVIPQIQLSGALPTFNYMTKHMVWAVAMLLKIVINKHAEAGQSANSHFNTWIAIILKMMLVLVA